MDYTLPPHYEVRDISTFTAAADHSLKEDSAVRAFFEKHPEMQETFALLAEKEEHVLLALIAIDQGELLLWGWDHHPQPFEKLKQLSQQLIEIEQFYQPIGGILGYHALFLKLYKESQEPVDEGFTYSKPLGVVIRDENHETRTLTVEALRHLGQTALVLPIGGAADRLMLRDAKTGEALPSACLQFGEHNLLEGIMRDWQAQEYLHYKLFKKQVKSPLVLMTSLEKNNHARIVEICEKNEWFSRAPERFFFIIQPSVPVLTEKGMWAFAGPLDLALKPSGHGVVWKLMEDKGVFDGLKNLGIQKAVVRQINNPLAATDYGMLAFVGKGWQGNYNFGFASAQRLAKVSSGILVLKEKETPDGYECLLTNIEYTDFKKYSIEDVAEPGSEFTPFAMNTNILFADLDVVRQAAKKRPFPGLLINLKSDLPCLNEDGTLTAVPAGRIETTMQNIADELVFKSQNRVSFESLPLYVTYNTLQRMHSAIKKQYVEGKPPEGTPEKSFYDSQINAGDLLRNHCHMAVPQFGSFGEFMKVGPQYICRFHPALGPCFAIIGQKIRGGSLTAGSELVLEIAELDMQNLELEGSLILHADDPMGVNNDIKEYSHAGGKCQLKNIRVMNAGIDRSEKIAFWKGEFPRKESLEIILHGNAEFFAENVTFKGAHKFEVPAGKRLIVFEKGGKIGTKTRPISAPTWHWEYVINENQSLKLLNTMGG